MLVRNVAVSVLHAPERLDFVALRIRSRALQGFSLANPFSDLHGGFGLMLHAHLRPIYEDLFGAQQDSAEVRGYVLRPARGLEGPVAADGLFDIELVLIGPALRHAASCLEALALLGVNGLTAGKHRFEVVGVAALAPAGERRVWSPEEGWCVHALAPVAAAEILSAPAAAGALRVELVTPMRLKHENSVLRTCPTPRVFVERLLGRMQLLATQQTGEPLLDKALKAELVAQARALRVTEASLEWVLLERYSARQRQRMENGGLRGSFALDVCPDELAGWLRLGSWLHVGAKTSFGLGQYRLSGCVNSGTNRERATAMPESQVPDQASRHE